MLRNRVTNVEAILQELNSNMKQLSSQQDEMKEKVVKLTENETKWIGKLDELTQVMYHTNDMKISRKKENHY